MKYMPSTDAQSDLAQNVNDDTLYDVTSGAATTPLDTTKAEGYTPVTYKAAGSIWKRINPRANTYDVAALRLIALVVISWPAAWITSYLAPMLPLPVCVGIFGALGVTLGAVLLTKSTKPDGGDLYSKFYFGLVAAGAMAAAGWLPSSLLIPVLGPLALGYGLGSMLAITRLALSKNARANDTGL